MFLQTVRNGKNHWWRWLLTVILVFLGYGMGQVPLYLLMVNAVTSANDGELNQSELLELAGSLDFAFYGVDQNWTLFMILVMFVFAAAALWLGVTKIHDRPFRELTTPKSRIDWGKIFFSFALWMAFSIGLEGIAYVLDPSNYVFNFQLSAFLPLLLIALILLPIQTSFEEWFMRGYLMQGISLWSVYRWVPLVITSLLFGLMHGLNPEVKEFGVATMMPYYIGVGLFLGILTLMDDSLELALGVHAATNIYGALFVTFDSSALQTPAVFRLKEVDVSLMIPVFFVAALIFTFICARRYGWRDWSRVYGRVERSDWGDIAREERPWDGDVLDQV